MSQKTREKDSRMVVGAERKREFENRAKIKQIQERLLMVKLNRAARRNKAARRGGLYLALSPATNKYLCSKFIFFSKHKKYFL